ncbi:MAG: hypothetical protein AAF544_09425 [Bacteroidota bacterium]
MTHNFCRLKEKIPEFIDAILPYLCINQNTILMRLLVFAFFIWTSAGPLSAQITAARLALEPVPINAFEDNLENGVPMPNLSWAWASNNACFVEPRRDKFSGLHRLYTTEIPPYSTMIIRLIPDNSRDEISLYAYSGGGGALPPELASCVSCEADFKSDRPFASGRDRMGPNREVELRAVNRGYPVTIGVAGANGLDTGAYRLEVEIVNRR